MILRLARVCAKLIGGALELQHIMTELHVGRPSIPIERRLHTGISQSAAAAPHGARETAQIHSLAKEAQWLPLPVIRIVFVTHCFFSCSLQSFSKAIGDV